MRDRASAAVADPALSLRMHGQDLVHLGTVVIVLYRSCAEPSREGGSAEHAAQQLANERRARRKQAREVFFLSRDQSVVLVVILGAGTRGLLFDEISQIRANFTDFLIDLGEAWYSRHFGGPSFHSDTARGAHRYPTKNQSAPFR